MRKTISPRRFLGTYRRNQAVAELDFEAVGKVTHTVRTGERVDISANGGVKSRFRSIAFAAFAVLFIAQVVVVSPAQQTDESGAPPAGATEEWAAAAKRAVAESEYEVNLRNVASAQNVEASYQAPNRAHHLRSHFTPDAVRIVPRTDEGLQWELSFSLVGYGRGTDVRPVDSPTLAPRGKSIDYHRGRLTEWYVNDERGLEQGFTLSGPPEDLRRGAVTLRVPGRRARSQKDDGSTEPAFVVLTLGGDLVPTVRPDGQAVDFALRSGGLSVLHYGDLKVVDALERELPAHMECFSEAGDRGIRIVFDDSDAVYPVIVDPLATNASWTGEGDREYAGFGWAVASAGDLNADGFDDVIVGAPYYDVEGPAAGAVFTYHGSPSGLSTIADATVEVLGGSGGWLMGVSVSTAGDVNGDGFDDVLVGMPRASVMWILFGSSDGLLPLSQGLGRIGPSGSAYGQSVAYLGDVNRDGFGDVAVGAPFDDSAGADSGKVFVYYGGPTALAVDPSWEKSGPAAGAQFGWTVAGGDVGASIDSDLIVSAPGPPDGQAFVYLGSATGLALGDSWNAQFAAKPDLWLCSATRTMPCTVDTDCPNGETCPQIRVNIFQEPIVDGLRDAATVNGGTYVAAVGDINDDGKGDWVVGSPYDMVNRGRVDLFYGSNTLPLPAAPSWSTFGNDGDLLGWAVAGAGDTNADGVDDFLIGARGVANTATDEGRASLHLGSSSGPTDEAAWQVEGNQFYASFGYSLGSAGDVNGDGIGDVIVGAINAKRGQYLEGLATVYLGSVGLTPVATGDTLGFDVLYTRAELQDFTRGVLSPLLASEAVGYGPSPASLLLSTGRASDNGLGNTDWGDPGADTTVFELLAAVPPAQKTFCFTSQFVTAESDPRRDKAFFCFDREGGTCGSPTYQLSALATQEKNPPVGHCIDVAGKPSLFLRFEVRDGGGDGFNDSAVILSRLYFSDLPLPADALDETTADGYFRNPAPQDISRVAGTYSYTKPLLSVSGVTTPFDLTVYYDSGSTSEGAMGSKWSHSYEAFAHILEDGPDAGTLPDSIQVRVGSRVEYFAETPDGLYKPQFGGSASSLTYDPASSGVVTYVTQDRTTHVFDRLANDSSLQLTSFSDVNGGQFQLSYDPSDRLTGVTDTRGKSFSFDYTSGGLLRSVRSDPGTPNEARVSFGYDVGAGVLNSITDLDGRITTFTTTDDSRILTGTNDDGVTFVSNSYEVFDSIAVDQQGNRVASRRDGRDSDLLDPDAGLRLTYDGDTVISTDRLVPARRESRQYDAKGRVAAQIDQTGVRTEYDYDRNNNRIETRRQLPSEPDPRILSKSDYDNRSNLLRAVDFPGVCIDDPGTSCANDTQCPGSTCGVTQSMTYDLDNNLRSIADHYGHRTSLDFDVSGNLVRERDPLGNEITLTYGAVPGRTVVSPIPESATNARGFSSFNELDSNGYLIRTVDPSGGSVSHTWDSRGRRNSTTDPLGHKTCLDYDEMGRVVRIRALCDSSSEFVQSSMTYDADGRELSRTDADGATSRIDYTTTGRVQARIDPLGRSDRYSYDLADRVTNIEKPSPSGRVGPTNSLRINTAVNYDDGDRPTDLTESFGNCVGGDPGATGQACTVDADCPGGGRCGVSVRAEYDEIGNLVRVEDPNGNVRRFEYDLLQRIVAQGEDTDDDGVIDPGSVERGTYDGRGLQTTLTTPRNQIITYRYDDAGRTTGRTFDGHALTHVMDGNGNRTLSVLDGAAVTRAFDPLDRLISRTDEFGNRVDAVRDLSGQLTELVYPSDLNGDGQRDKVIYGYDDLGRMTSVEDWDGNRTTYGYDRVGRLVRATLPDGNVVTYRYDAAGRLIEISDPGGEFSAAYTLNEAGLRTKASLSLPLDPSIPETDVTYAHGPRNELLSSSDGATFTYDESGNLVTGTIGGSPVAMTHNALNQLESINGESYRYDADGLRIETDRNGVVHRYVYDMVSGVPRVLEEQDESGNVVSRYVHGVGLISRKGPEGLRVYHHDSRGSTVSLTDGSGTVTDRYAYDPFGKLAGHTGGTIQPFRYNGRDGVFDDDNGLYYMSARYYAPELQRFIEMDQAFKGDLTDTQSLNRYAFVVGDPIQLVDPDGEWGWIAIGALVGAAVGGITSTVAECLDGCKWDEALGAAAEGIIAGAITGAVLAATGGAVAGGSLGAWGAVGANAAAGAVAAAVGNAANQGITIAGGSQDEFNFVELGVATAAGLVVGAVSGGVSVGSQAATLSARAFPTRSLRALQSANFQGTLVRDLGSKAGIGLQLLGKVGGKILPEYETLPTLPKNSYAGRVLAGRAFQSERQ